MAGAYPLTLCYWYIFWNHFAVKIIYLKFSIMATLSNKKVAILTEHGFEESELTEPKKALENAGATVHIVSAQKTVKGWKDGNWSVELTTDRSLEDTQPEEFDALLIPGGVINPDLMRRNPAYIHFAKAFLEAGKPVGAICHGPQLLIETGMLKDRKMTSFPSIKTDLENAGVQWTDAEVVTDRGLVTSRKPADIPAFNKKIIEEFAEGIHETKKSFEIAS